MSHLVPQTPDQEAFLKEHFVTLADLSASGTDQSVELLKTRETQNQHSRTTNRPHSLFCVLCLSK